jgi:uncharacterized protein
MPERVLDATISAVLGSELVRDDIEFIWHAGEPLTVGIPFYEKALELIAQHNARGIRVKNSIQTNGTRINPSWCRFLSVNGFCVGLSLDGPDWLHDRQRVNWAGRGSHSNVMRGFRLLKEHGISPGVICVLTRESLRHPAEIFDFFLKNGVDFLCFNVEEVEHLNTVSSLTEDAQASPSEIVAEYSLFMSQFYDLWRPQYERMTIREFRDLAGVFYNAARDAEYACEPLETVDLGIITVQKNGDVTTYSPEFAGARSAEYGNFVVGNVTQDSLSSVVQHPTFHKMRAGIRAGIGNCRDTCGFFRVCGGAFTSNKFFENGSLESTVTTTCLLHRQTLALVLADKLSRTKVQSNHPAATPGQP